MAPNGLLDSGLLCVRNRHLRHNNREDGVLQIRLDFTPVDSTREGKAAVEFSNGALARSVSVPVLGLGYGLVTHLDQITTFTLAFPTLGSFCDVELTFSSAFDHQGVWIAVIKNQCSPEECQAVHI